MITQSLWMAFFVNFFGTFRGDLLVGDTWYQGDKLIQFMTAAATPTPSIEPVLTPEPTAEPSFQPSFEPFTEPAAEVTEAPLAIAAADPFAQTEIAGDPDDGWFIVDDPVDTFADDGLGLEEPTDEPAVETAASSEPFVVARTTPQAQPIAEPSAAPQLAEATGEPILLTDLIADNSEWDEIPPEAQQTADAAQTAEAADGLAGDAAAQSEWDEIPPEAQQAADAAQTAGDTASASMARLSMEPDESALPSVLKIKDDVYDKAKKVTELERGLSLDMPGPGSYVSYEGGVFTFRGDAFRGNAAFGMERELNVVGAMDAFPGPIIGAVPAVLIAMVSPEASIESTPAKRSRSARSLSTSPSSEKSGGSVSTSTGAIAICSASHDSS